MDQIFRGMTRAELDVAYNNVKAQPDYAALMAGFHERSRAIYETFDVERDHSYGPEPRQRFDWLPCGQPDAPTFVFIHGGYWQNYAKDELAFVAQGPLARGFDVVLAEYTLAPQASMTRIVREIRTLLDHLAASDSPFGFGGQPVCLCGHSAGGQLAALHRGHPAISGTIAISGLFDLEPIARSWLNDKLQLTAAEIANYSPMRQISRGASTVIPVGAAELPRADPPVGRVRRGLLRQRRNGDLSAVGRPHPFHHPARPRDAGLDAHGHGRQGDGIGVRLIGASYASQHYVGR